MSLAKLENTDNSWEKGSIIISWVQWVTKQPVTQKEERWNKERNMMEWNTDKTYKSSWKKICKERCEEIDGKPKRFKKWVL